MKVKFSQIYIHKIIIHFTDASDDSDKSATDGRKRKKMRMQDIQEETGIESGFAKKLDLTCMSKGLVRAPDINDGYIVKYNR